MGSDAMTQRSIRAELETLCVGESLSQSQCHDVFSAVMRGEVGAAELSALLIALKIKGESADEIAGAARAMREAALTLDTGDLAVADSCGTGGDGASTVNISTAAALVAAEGGAHVAKHGNRSISSKCGSADVLEQLGITLEATPATSRKSLEELGICFLYAPQYHAGVRHAMPVRRALAVRTMFNLLGPLANPALPAYQLMGVYDPARCITLATTLGKLGVRRAMVVHGGGLDEIALHAPTIAALVEHGEVRKLELTPEAVGFGRRGIAELRGGDPASNAAWLWSLLSGEGVDAHNEAVAINAGALLWIAELANNHRAGTEAALAILRSGKTAERFARWRDLIATGPIDGP